MTILANGCSFTEGYNLADPQLAWPHQLGKILNQNVVITFNTIIEHTLYKTAHNNHLKGAPVSPLMVHTYF